MEHVTMTSARWGYTTLKADNGYLLRSKKTGRTYQEITVPNPTGFEVIPLPTSATAAKKAGKPKAKKRA